MPCPECYHPGSALPRRGPRLAPPRSYFIAAPNVQLWSALLSILPAPPLPQPVIVSEASLDNSLGYYINGGDAPECASNAVVRVHAIVQTWAPSSAQSSPNPFVGVQIVGTFLAHNACNNFPVFQVPAAQRPQSQLFQEAACEARALMLL